MRRHYKKHSSGFADWEQKEHAEDYMLFAENIGSNISIDEVSLSKGEIYTFVTNKSARSKKGTLIASIKGTQSKALITVLEQLPLHLRNQVKEVTLDMAKNIELAVKTVFTQCTLVTDRFHVVKLATEALQHYRVKLRWEELDKENDQIMKAKGKKEKYIPEILSNGDTPKQLLARSRYIIAKKQYQWTENQKVRAELLFEKYPKLKDAYEHTIAFRNIYDLKHITKAKTQFNIWIEETYKNEMKTFYTAAKSLKANFNNILNFFINRNTNANAESFNAKIKLFRANLRGVTDTTFFLFRLFKLFA